MNILKNVIEEIHQSTKNEIEKTKKIVLEIISSNSKKNQNQWKPISYSKKLQKIIPPSGFKQKYNLSRKNKRK